MLSRAEEKAIGLFRKFPTTRGGNGQDTTDESLTGKAGIWWAPTDAAVHAVRKTKEAALDFLRKEESARPGRTIITHVCTDNGRRPDHRHQDNPDLVRWETRLGYVSPRLAVSAFCFSRSDDQPQAETILQLASEIRVIRGKNRIEIKQLLNNDGTHYHDPSKLTVGEGRNRWSLDFRQIGDRGDRDEMRAFKLYRHPNSREALSADSIGGINVYKEADGTECEVHYGGPFKSDPLSHLQIMARIFGLLPSLFPELSK